MLNRSDNFCPGSPRPNCFRQNSISSPGCRPTWTRARPPRSWSWRSRCRCWQRSIPPGGRRGSLRARRHAMSDAPTNAEEAPLGILQGIGRPRRKEASRRAVELLTYLGLGERLSHRPAELSGGEQQRVAIARAVANAPRILLADEPTGNLDPRTSDHVFNALTQLVRASGLAVRIATHNMEIAARMDRRVTLKEGLVVELE